ncbi:hypothetical protein FA95DRAFT_508192 [Auriscalpium vulgare]|uniref:Uncharacterized protein n=1 Tax=Auriscalpium vulgare TaxID=40419 RepID=A0ACB8RFM9_9AGAM|nr:hypothetical protein FA95DRAFT_508192 [Auriscalpium vulgare]
MPSYLLCAAFRKNIDHHANSPVVKRRCECKRKARRCSGSRRHTERLQAGECRACVRGKDVREAEWAIIEATARIAYRSRLAQGSCSLGLGRRDRGKRCSYSMRIWWHKGQDELRGQMRCSVRHTAAWYQRWTQSWILGETTDTKLKYLTEHIMYMLARDRTLTPATNLRRGQDARPRAGRHASRMRRCGTVTRGCTYVYVKCSIQIPASYDAVEQAHAAIVVDPSDGFCPR